MAAVRTSLDFSIANGLRARRRLAETDVEGKLRILRRLDRQYVLGSLPRSTESNVEQSWNEQVFASVLGYQTQFSHDRLPFHMKAKNFQEGYFSDFSLGFFSPTSDRVLASAELKGPTASLDRPQGRKYEYLTPIDQAFRTARAEPGCLWVIVSNFTELRLYDIGHDEAPLLQADLRQIAESADLAMFVALMDQRALLGDGHRHAPELGIMTNLTDDHPANPVPSQDGCYRVVLRFTPKPEQEIPLFKIEQGLRTGIPAPPGSQRFFQEMNYGRGLHLAPRLKDGWVAVDGGNDQVRVVSRVSMSRLGQLQASFRFHAELVGYAGRDRLEVSFVCIVAALRYFAALLRDVYPMDKMEGLLSAELREVDGAFMEVERGLLAERGPNSGVAEQTDILAGDFRWIGGDDTLDHVQSVCACELAAHFRGQNGGIATDQTKVQEAMRD